MIFTYTPYSRRPRWRKDPRLKVLAVLLTRFNRMRFVPSRDLLPDRNRYGNGVQIGAHLHPRKRWRHLP